MGQNISKSSVFCTAKMNQSFEWNINLYQLRFQLLSSVEKENTNS